MTYPYLTRSQIERKVLDVLAPGDELSVPELMDEVGKLATVDEVQQALDQLVHTRRLEVREQPSGLKLFRANPDKERRGLFQWLGIGH